MEMLGKIASPKFKKYINFHEITNGSSMVCNEKDSHYIVWVVVDILGNNDYKAMEL